MLRFVVSSKGDIDISSLRIALLNFIKSQQGNESFIIRVDDTLAESIEGEEQESIDILKKFAINCENIMYQSKNLSIYQQMAKKLVDQKKAFACFCSNIDRAKTVCKCRDLEDSEIAKQIADKERFSLQIVEPVESITLLDTIKGEITLKSEEIGSFTLLNEDAKPSAIFANSVDDMSGAISAIIKEGDIVNSARESYIHKELGYSGVIEYTHLSSIVESSSENIALKELLSNGFLPDAIINYFIALSVKCKERLFYLPDAVEWLELDSESVVSSKFDIHALRSLNQEHLQNMDSKKLSSIFGFADADIGELLKLYLDKAETINELESLLHTIFSKKECNKSDNIYRLAQFIADAPYFKEYREFIHYMQNSSGLEEDELLKRLKLLLTGMESGPELEAIYPYLKSYLLEVAQCQ